MSKEAKLNQYILQNCMNFAPICSLGNGLLIIKCHTLLMLFMLCSCKHTISKHTSRLSSVQVYTVQKLYNVVDDVEGGTRNNRQVVACVFYE